MEKILCLWCRSHLSADLSSTATYEVIHRRERLELLSIDTYQGIILLAVPYWERELQSNLDLTSYFFSRRSSLVSIYVVSFLPHNNLQVLPHLNAISLLPNGQFIRLPNEAILRNCKNHKVKDTALLQRLKSIYTERYYCHDHSLTDSLNDLSWDLELLYYENSSRFYSTWQIRIVPRLLTIAMCYREFIANTMVIPEWLKTSLEAISKVAEIINNLENNIKTLLSLIENRKELFGGVCTIIEITDQQIKSLISHIVIIRESINQT